VWIGTGRVFHWPAGGGWVKPRAILAFCIKKLPVKKMAIDANKVLTADLLTEAGGKVDLPGGGSTKILSEGASGGGSDAPSSWREGFIGSRLKSLHTEQRQKKKPILGSGGKLVGGGGEFLMIQNHRKHKKKAAKQPCHNGEDATTPENHFIWGRDNTEGGNRLYGGPANCSDRERYGR